MITYRTLASGRTATVDHRGRVVAIGEWDDFDEGPCCGICDGLGHGAEHGLRPCPIEDSGRWDPRDY